MLVCILPSREIRVAWHFKREEIHKLQCPTNEPMKCIKYEEYDSLLHNVGLDFWVSELRNATCKFSHFVKLFLSSQSKALFRMIIPVRCFTCGKVIGDKWEKYNEMIAAPNGYQRA